MINLGFYTLDIQSKVVFQTSDPYLSEQHFEFEEVTSIIKQKHERSDKSRFKINFTTDQQISRNRNKLGNAWAQKYCGDTFWNSYDPSINQIRKGLKKYEKKQLEKSSNLDPSSKEFKEAFKNKCQALDSYFDEITGIDHN